MSDERSEALRYLGAREADAPLDALLGRCFQALDAVRPRHVLRVFPTQTILSLFGSQALRAHIGGCTQAALLAATLGAETDFLIRRAEAVDTLHAACLHACAAARIEAYCDTVQAGVPGAEMARFSPGYGDFPLASQRPLLDALDAGRRIGLYLTDADMLVPSKSVTAVLGLGSACGMPCGGLERNENSRHKCSLCDKQDCAFRGGLPHADQ